MTWSWITDADIEGAIREIAPDMGVSELLDDPRAMAVAKEIWELDARRWLAKAKGRDPDTGRNDPSSATVFCPVTGHDLTTKSRMERCTHLYYYAHRDRALHYANDRSEETMRFLAMDAWNMAAAEATSMSESQRSSAQLILDGVMRAQATWGYFPGDDNDSEDAEG